MASIIGWFDKRRDLSRDLSRVIQDPEYLEECNRDLIPDDDERRDSSGTGTSPVNNSSVAKGSSCPDWATSECSGNSDGAFHPPLDVSCWGWFGGYDGPFDISCGWDDACDRYGLINWNAWDLEYYFGSGKNSYERSTSEDPGSIDPNEEKPKNKRVPCGRERIFRKKGSPAIYPMFTVRWTSIHGLAIPTVAFLGAISTMQFIQL